uniref:Mitochondrial fission factor n=1 Tax=Oryctolagus cuniculus TaxID=9986 RepID=G1TTD5_RABIT
SDWKCHSANGQSVGNDSTVTPTPIDTGIEGTSEDITAVEAAMLRRQIIKLNRRLHLLEEENKERSRREMILYSITVAFWLFSSWFWLRR